MRVSAPSSFFRSVSVRDAAAGPARTLFTSPRWECRFWAVTVTCPGSWRQEKGASPPVKGGEDLIRKSARRERVAHADVVLESLAGVRPEDLGFPAAPATPSARQPEPARRPGRSTQSPVECRQWKLERLGNRDVPGIVAGDRAAEVPYPGRERLEWHQKDVEVEKIPLGSRCLETTEELGALEPPQDVRRLDQDEMRGDEVPLAENLLGPGALCTGVGRRSDEHRRIDDRAHRRSVSLCFSICFADTRTSAEFFRSRTRSSHAWIEGRAARRPSSPLRYSCMDMPS